MAIRVGINGLGRIGRHVLKLCLNHPSIDVVGINEINPDIGNWCYTLNHDSIYGKSPDSHRFSILSSCITYQSRQIYTSHHSNIIDVPWNTWGVDYVIDCTGVNSNVKRARDCVDVHSLQNLFISHSPPEELVDMTMILGVNHDNYHSSHKVIASSICDATAIAPITKVIHDNFNIQFGYVTTLHPWLSYQNLLDGASSSWSVPGEIYHHYALGRSAINNIIPKPTSAMDAVFKVLPQLDSSKIGSFSYRLPVSIVASADITYTVAKNVSSGLILEALQCFQSTQCFPIIKLDNEPLTSLDYISESHSCVVDTRWLNVVGSNTLKLVLWYDNEFGYANNVVRQLIYVDSVNSLSSPSN